MLNAIGAGAALLLACAAPATSHADAPPVVAAAPQPTARGCGCPVRQHRHAWRAAVHTRLYAGHWRRWWPAPVAVVMPPPPVAYAPVYYNPVLPDEYDSAYDRTMTWHYRSPAVSGEYFPDREYPPPPPVWGGHRYRYWAGDQVFQYDGMADSYIPR
jgi:hypothetical protein